MLGEMSSPFSKDDNKLKKIPIYCTGKKMGFLAQIPTQNPKMIIEKKDVRLKFSNGYIYKGHITDDFELSGWATITDEEGNHTCGLFSNEGISYEIYLEDKENVLTFMDLDQSFFEDSEKYIKNHPYLTEPPMLLLVNKSIDESFSESEYIGYDLKTKELGTRVIGRTMISRTTPGQLSGRNPERRQRSLSTMGLSWLCLTYPSVTLWRR